MRHVKAVAISIWLVAAVGAAARGSSDDPSPQSKLVNIETPDVVPTGIVAGRIDLRFFDHPEDLVYTSAGLRYGLYHGLELGIRGVTAGTKGLLLPGGGAILHGGRDAELYGKYALKTGAGFNLAALAGVGFPSTPAQHRAILTLGGMGSWPATSRVTLFLNPRGTFQEGNITAGVGVGAHVQVSPRVSIVGDWTGILDGENTRSTTTGARIKGDVWGIALRFTSTHTNGAFDIDLGYGNATGSTTGFSLTPGLGSSAGFYFALTARH